MITGDLDGPGPLLNSHLEFSLLDIILIWMEREICRSVVQLLAKLSKDNSAKKALEIADKEYDPGTRFFYDDDCIIVKFENKDPVKVPIQH